MTRETMGRIGAIGTIVLALVGAFVIATGAFGSDDSTNGCSPGEWVHATVVAPNGDTLRVDNKRQLPHGYSATTESGKQKVTVSSNGSVTATGGEVVVECVQPTH